MSDIIRKKCDNCGAVNRSYERYGMYKACLKCKKEFKKERVCGNCGKAGHNRRTCTD